MKESANLLSVSLCLSVYVQGDQRFEHSQLISFEAVSLCRV